MSYSYDESLAAGAAIFTGAFLFIVIIALIIGIIAIISMAKIFKKAGKPAWAAIIPIYNLFIMVEIAGLPNVYVLLLIIPVVNIYAYIKAIIEISKKFGKSLAFAIVTILFPFIGLPILASEKYPYNGGSKMAVEGVAPSTSEAETTEPVPDVIASPELSAVPINQSLNIETQSLSEVEAAKEKETKTPATTEDIVETNSQEVEASVQSVSSVSDEQSPAEVPTPEPEQVEAPVEAPTEVPSEPTPSPTAAPETPIENKDNSSL